MLYVLSLTGSISERGEQPQAELRRSPDGLPIRFGQAPKATLIARMHTFTVFAKYTQN